MKTKLTLLLLCVFEFFNSTAQTIRIADNNPTRPTGANIYPTLQAAINAAVSGDLVYVQPSITTYGDVKVDHKITLRGIGFNTGKDIAFSSIVASITLTNNNGNTTNANATTIEGLMVTNYIDMGPQTNGVPFALQNITVSNCSVNWIGRGNSGYGPAQNITIQNCSIFGISFVDSNLSQLLMYGNIFTGRFEFGAACGSPFGNCSQGSGTLSTAVISNNIFTQSMQSQFYNTTISGLAITNNIFFAGTDKNGSRFLTGQLTDASIANNIFYGTAPVSSGSPFERNTFFNNISFGTTNDAFPPAGTGVGNTGGGNIPATDPKFTNATYGIVWAATMDFTLAASSPAKNAGTDLTDIGITGGTYPVTSGNVILGASHAPVIISFNPATVVPQSQPILTNIKAKSN